MHRLRDLEILAAKHFPAENGDPTDAERRSIVMSCAAALEAGQRAYVRLEFIPPNIWEEIDILPNLPRDLECTLETCLRLAEMRLGEALNHVNDALYRLTMLRDELWVRENDLAQK